MLLVEWPILCKTVAHADALRALSHFKAYNNEAGVHGFSNVHASETLMIIRAFLVSSPIAIGSTGPLHTLIASSPHVSIDSPRGARSYASSWQAALLTQSLSFEAFQVLPS